jgi:hypothetical protein
MPLWEIRGSIPLVAAGRAAFFAVKSAIRNPQSAMRPTRPLTLPSCLMLTI